MKVFFFHSNPLDQYGKNHDPIGNSHQGIALLAMGQVKGKSNGIFLEVSDKLTRKKDGGCVNAICIADFG